MDDDWIAREKDLFADYVGLAPGLNWTSAHVSDFVTWLAAKRDARASDLWREAVLDECAIACANFFDHDPRRTLTALIDWHVQLALDPAVSEPIAKLVAQARRLARKNAVLMGRNRQLRARLDDQCDLIGDLAAVAEFRAMLATGNVRLNVIEDDSIAPDKMVLDLPDGRTLSLDAASVFGALVPGDE